MTMIIRRDDINGDFVFGHGLSDYLIENDAIALLLKDRLLLWLAEWFLDISQGVDWTAILGSKPPALTYAESEVRRITLATDGVVAITDLSVTFDHQTFIVGMVVSITTIFSTSLTVAVSQTLQAGKR